MQGGRPPRKLLPTLVHSACRVAKMVADSMQTAFSVGRYVRSKKGTGSWPHEETAFSNCLNLLLAGLTWCSRLNAPNLLSTTKQRASQHRPFRRRPSARTMAADAIRPLTVAATPVKRTPITRTGTTGIGEAPTAMAFTSLADTRVEPHNGLDRSALIQTSGEIDQLNR